MMRDANGESQYHAAVKLKAFLFHFPLPIKATKNLHESIPCFLHPSKVCIMDGKSNSTEVSCNILERRRTMKER